MMMNSKTNKINSKIVIGLLGTIASGKGTMASFLVKQYGFKRIIMGDLVRAEARKRGIKATRENLHNLQARIRAKGKHYFINKAIERIKKSRMQRWVVDGIRNPDQAASLKKAFNAKIIFIDAPVKLRWERARKRGRTYEAKETLKEFIQREKEENKIFNFHITKKYADYKIINDVSKKELYKKIKKIIKRILK